MWKFGIRIFVVCFLHCLLWTYTIAKDGLIPNGDFKVAPPFWGMAENVIIGQNLLPNWETKGLVQYISLKEKHDDKQYLVVPREGFGVRLGNDGKLSQRIQGLKRGSLYSLSFTATGTCAGRAETLNVTVVPYESQVVPMQTSWNTYALSFTALDSTHQLILGNPAKQDLQYPKCGPLIVGVAIKELSKGYQIWRRENLLWNGDFEEGPLDFLNGTNGIHVLPVHNNSHYSLGSPVPGWTIESIKPAKYIDSAHFRVPQGSRAVELLESVLSQTRYTKPGSELRLSLSVGDAGNGCKGSMVVEVFGGKESFKVPYESKGTGGFTTAVFKYISHAETTRVALRSSFIGRDKSGSLCGPVVDDVKLVAM